MKSKIIVLIFLMLNILGCATFSSSNKYVVFQIQCYPNIDGLELYYDDIIIGETDFNGKFIKKLLTKKAKYNFIVSYSSTLIFRKNKFEAKFNFSEDGEYLESIKIGKEKINANKYISFSKERQGNSIIYKFEIKYDIYLNDINKQLLKKNKLKKMKDYIDSLEQTPRWINSLDVNFREGPSTNKVIISTLREGFEVYFQKEEKGWSNVLYKEKKFNLEELKSNEEILNCYLEGWIFSNLLSSKFIPPISKSYYNLLKNIKIERKERHKQYFNKYPNTELKFKNAIKNNEIILGMTSEMVKASWGYPDDINRTVTLYSVHEQWIYGDYDSYIRYYLYFDNDKLTSWQENK